MYPLIRRLLFLFSAEDVHYFSMNALRAFCRTGFKKLVSGSFTPGKTSLSRNIFGLHFKNPVGLGAGFDKNALYLNELQALGFGFIEIGTVTPLPQAGNEKPRLFRLAKDKALINRMGFNNDGAEVITGRLKAWKEKEAQRPTGRNNYIPVIIGGNIGKNKQTPNEDAWRDYEICFNVLFDYVDYFVVNVSSPNTPGLRELQEKDSLRKILVRLQYLNNSKAKRKPLLLKIAPDLTHGQLDDIIELALEIKLDGLVATNTTISRDGLSTSGEELEAIGAGGLSGKPVREKSTDVLKYLTKSLGSQIPVIASGGIFTAADAQEKINAGAALVQVWTGFIYEGPGIVNNICKALHTQ